MRGKRPVFIMSAGVLLLFLIAPAWLVYGKVRQDRLDHALIAAIKGDNTPAALRLLDQGADANARDEPHRRFTFRQLLLDLLHGVHPRPSHAPTALLLTLERRASQYDTASIWYVQRGDPRLMAELLAKGARVNIRDEHGFTPLILSSIEMDRKAVKLLLEHHASAAAAGTYGMTPLMFAIYQPEIVKLLLARGAPVDAQDIRGWTALMCAAAQGRADTVQILLAAHADPNLRDCNGDTALDVANYTMENYKQIVRLLKEAGAKR